MGSPTLFRCLATRSAVLALGEAEGLHHADRHPFAMQQALRIAGGGFQCMAEGVSEIEECAHAGLVLILGDDLGLGLAGLADRMNALL